MRFRFLLRPGWLALTLAVWVFAGACFTMLMPWQFGRNDERVAQNDALTTAMKSEPVPVGTVLDRPNSEIEWHKVSLTGKFLPAGEAVARLRTVQGEAAFEVVTPFLLDSGQTVLVDRGYLRPASGVSVPDVAAPPTTRVTTVAWVRAGENDNRDAFTEDGRRQVYAINSAVVGRAAGLDIRPGYFQLSEGQPGVLDALPLPRMESGPFFSYALQWIAFGVMAIGGWAYFSWREIQPGGALTEPRPRRKTVAEMLAEDEAGTGLEAGSGSVLAASGEQRQAGR
ncbi:SURF1 family cytochrome oxidase biogenesis protein [Umezawaea sp. Da 62-37]|uniref:SURF1 family cytochrome oxidase biogenesis protein n=1 Tax=Umezawaea sp. Da 62-37 TaxID=3075927 RepID=UPI0028F73C75|nr:SURF1 family cytochrome oxidase biogenesis protein [Umezawaea sp. Da 62-37]WNV82520.1 SURF1 family cytochrome oxidase biogenesis protein [Umezawaea sp. Da 62-37]